MIEQAGTAHRRPLIGARPLWLLPLIALAACASSPVPPERTQADIAWVAEGEFCEPETVLPLPDGTLLVSNVCGFGSAGDGFLSLLDTDGSVLDWRKVDGLDSPLGMAMGEGQIHVVDANRIKTFAWPGFALIEVIELDMQVANDVAPTRGGTLYISDTAAGRVIVVDPLGHKSELALETQFEGANGIELGPDGALYVGGTRLWRVDLTKGEVEQLGPDWLKDIDGIEFERDGTLQVTPVGGPLIRLWQDGRVEVIEGEGVSSANHGYSAEAGLALIPTGYDNTVIAIRVPGASPNPD